MSNKNVITEIYDVVKDNYITIKKTETSRKIWYTLEKENCSDGRSKSSLELNADELRVMASLLNEILEEER